MNTFLVCGLPRSGLAWLSRFASVPRYSHSFCDLCSQADSAESFWRHAETFAEHHALVAVGNAEILNLALLPALLTARPLTRVLYIDRGLTESRRAAEDAGQEIPDWLWQSLWRYRAKGAEHFDAVVPFAGLHELAVMHPAFQVLFGNDVPFSPKRFHAFARKKILCEKTTLSPEKFAQLNASLGREVEVLPALG